MQQKNIYVTTPAYPSLENTVLEYGVYLRYRVG